MSNCTAGNANLRQLILEVIGVIISNISVKKIFHLVGPSNTGKSQFARLCIGLVGEAANYSIKGFNDLTSRFGLSPLVGKKLCTCLDLPDTTIGSDTVGVLKQLVGDDPILGERKYKDPFTFYNEATLLCAGNHPLRVKNLDTDDAFIRRIITIPFFNPVPPERWIDHLSEKMLKESGYIVKQAIGALNDLRDRNFVFTEVAVPEPYQAVDNQQDDIRDFIQVSCELHTDAKCSSECLYKAYCDFCSGFARRATSYINFTRLLNKLGLPIESNRYAGGKRGFKGIRLQSDGITSTMD